MKMSNLYNVYDKRYTILEAEILIVKNFMIWKTKGLEMVIISLVRNGNNIFPNMKIATINI